MIRRISTDGRITTYAGTDSDCNCLDATCPCFEPDRHLAANAKDRNVSNYAQDLLDAADDQETNPASTSENKGQDTAP